MNPKTIVVTKEWNRGIHRHHVGIGSEWQQDSRKDGEDFHGLIQLVGKKRIVRVLECLNRFLLAFEQVPQSDVGTDEILIVDFEILGDVRMVLLDERFDDGSLWFEGTTKVEDVSFQY